MTALFSADVTPHSFDVDLEHGRVSAALYRRAESAPALGLLVLAHGAGAGRTHPFMTMGAAGLAARGADVVLFNFPYMEAKRRTPDRAPVLEACFRRVVAAASAEAGAHGGPLFIGGKSMGGRIATHLAATPEDWIAARPLSGVIALGYPLNPPGGRRSADRVSYLRRIAVPTLIVQGTRDSFGGPADIRAALAEHAPEAPIEVHAVEAGDHSFAVLKSLGRSQNDVYAAVLDAVAAWMAKIATA